MDGILCIDKPTGMTSFLCCAVVRRLLGVKKVGHAGTLDPNATGVLPLLVGKATKALEHLPSHDKRYTATLRFGAVSDTLDIWGTVSETGQPLPTQAAIEAALPAFRGVIWQMPPMTSALKKDGVRLYDLARQGIEVERKARPVTIDRLELVAYDGAAGELTLDCRCSKGTYIRTLCHDIGQKLGCGGVMDALRRTEAAGFTLEQAVTVEQVVQAAEAGQAQSLLMPVDTYFARYPALTIQGKAERLCRHGNGFPWEGENGRYRVYGSDGSFLMLGEIKDGEMKTVKNFLEVESQG